MVEKQGLETQISRYAFVQIVTGLRSHFVYPTVQADFVPEKQLAVCCREVSSKGSLRDVLHQAKWSRPAEEKYQTNKKATPFSEARIITWGRHILEGANYLRLKGLPPGHIHAGNIIVDNNVCRITDYENKLLNFKVSVLMHVGFYLSINLCCLFTCSLYC